MSTQTDHNTEAAILERIIEPESDTLDPALARHILSLNFRAADHQRMHVLSAKAQEGTLTEDEERELDSYLHLGNFLALLKSKARISLKRTGLPV